MRIALNATALLSPLTGLGQYTRHLSQGLLAKSGLELDLFYGAGWSKVLRERPVQGIATLKALVKRFVPSPYPVNRFIQQRRFDAGIRSNRPDIYHEPNSLAFECSQPSIVTAHDLSWIRFPQTHPIDRVRAMNRYFERGLRCASLVLTDSAFVKRELIDVFGLRPEVIVPVPLGVEPMFHPRSSVETREVLNRHSLVYGQYLLAVGTLEPRKNLQLALQAFAQLPTIIRKRYPLVLVGMIGWHVSALEAQIAPLVRAGEVRQLGYLSREDLAMVVAGALTLIYPSIYEGFGLPPLEAMACGVPVIASDVSSIPEVVGDTGILTHPQDADAVANAIQLFVNDSGKRFDYSRRALERSKAFTWNQCVAQTVAAYQKVLLKF